MGAIGQQIPPLTLVRPAGGAVRAWDYKQKRNLVVVFVPSGEPPRCRELIGRLVAEEHRLEQLETAVLLVFSTLAAAEAAPVLPGFVAGIASAESRTAWLGDAGDVGVFVADRYGELYARWLAEKPLELPAVEEILDWLWHIEIACEECGVNTWPRPA